MKRIVVFIFLCGLISGHLHAQEEVVTPLIQNSDIEKKLTEHNPKALHKHNIIDTLNLPFFDDFSSSSVFPLDTLWHDRYVYVNNNFPISPPTIGVATFDGLNQYGRPYSPGIIGDKGHGADTLTSMALRMGQYSNASDVYLSFFYQAGGYGDRPEEYDSLVVEFKAHEDSIGWIRVWSTPGVRTTDTITGFSEAIIKVGNHPLANFFYDGFQFRFINYANRSGNLDQWHVDYVLLDAGRSAIDTSYVDAAMIYPIPSLLKTYASMPFDHYTLAPSKHLRTIFPFVVHNLHTTNSRTIAMGYSIYHVNNQTTLRFDDNLNTQTIGPRQRPTFNQTITSFNIPGTSIPDDTITLHVKTFLRTSPDRVRSNDTALWVQAFSNYFAYDDGTAEGGYGIQNSRTGGAVALKFELEEQDSLRGVSIHFNASNEDLSQRTFNLIIWKRLDPTEEIVYQINNLTPVYKDMLNGFYTFIFENDTAIALNGTFYVGWEQDVDYNLNVGYDRHYERIHGGNTNPNLFVNLLGYWRPSSLPGTPMIRPVFSNNPLPASVKPTPKPEPARVHIYPNPAKDKIYIQAGREPVAEVTIYNMQGRVVQKSSQSDDGSVDISSLKPGIYLLQGFTRNGNTFTQKLLIQR